MAVGTGFGQLFRSVGQVGGAIEFLNRPKAI